MGMDPKEQRRHATVGERVEALGADVATAVEKIGARLDDLERRADELVKADDTGRVYVDEVFRDEREYAERLHREALRHYADVDGMLHEFRDRPFLRRLRWLLTGH